MRELITILAAAVGTISALAQGTVNFNNRVTPVIDAPIYVQYLGSPELAGAGSLPNMSAQLYQINGPVFTPIGQATTFRAPTAANPLLAAYVNPISSMAVNGAAPGSAIQVMMRVWQGDNFDTALIGGQTAPVSVILGGDIAGAPTAVPGLLNGLQGFTIFIVPEPSTIALGLCGAAALLYRRRS
jgi:hypothetical protein